MTTDALFEHAELPGPIAAFVEAVNTGDRGRVLATFADSAVLDDGREAYVGKQAIATWTDTDVASVGGHIDVLGCRPDGRAYAVAVRVVAKGHETAKTFEARRTMTFTLDGDLITRVVIDG